MRRPHLQLVRAADEGPWPSGAVCRRFGCAAEAIELGLCALCLARYRSQRGVDEARLAALTRQLIRQPAALIAGWPTELKRPLARNLAAQLLWDRRPAIGGEPGWEAAIATLADALDECQKRR
jgi:hypothetical protein